MSVTSLGLMGKVAAGRASGIKNFYQNIQMHYDHESIPDQLRPELPTTTSGVAQQGTCENYATTEHSKNKRRKRGGLQVKNQQEVWKGRHSLITVGTLNDWKGKRDGRLGGAKECRHTVPTGNKVERK